MEREGKRERCEGWPTPVGCERGGGDGEEVGWREGERGRGVAYPSRVCV